jgi:hypothetical protein
MNCDGDALQALAHHEELLHERKVTERNNNTRNEKMGFRLKQQSNGNFKVIPQGAHPGVMSMFVDLGLQPGGNYEPAYKMIMGFQLTGPDVTTDKGEPMVITAKYTQSMHKKSNLRPLIENWFGKSFPSEEAARDFDPTVLLGRAGLVNVKHKERNGKTYPEIASIGSLPAGLPKPELKGEVLYYSDDLPLDARNAAYARLPEWIKKLVDNQLRVKPEGEKAAAEAAVEGDDDIPF